ncbi:hypothetical protein ACFY3J_33755 [Streptomyces sp. NPDC001231]|uniref:hypothetical protein n=1 Tax=Streptomyces sp. NPDC001231 TaxID=3364549 RepID=UPI0036993638
MVLGPRRRPARTFRWGTQLDVRPVKAFGDGSEVTEQAVAGAVLVSLLLAVAVTAPAAGSGCTSGTGSGSGVAGAGATEERCAGEWASREDKTTGQVPGACPGWDGLVVSPT